MLRRVLFLLMTPLIAFAGNDADAKLVDKPSGLEVQLPDGWKRRTDMESRNRPLVAIYPVEGGSYVQFVAEVAISDNYDADAWVAQQKKNLGSLFAKLDHPLAIQERKLGGLDAVGFVLSGTKDDKAIRARVYHVVRGARFFQFTEVSFAEAHKTAGDEAIDGVWEGIAFGEPTEGVRLQEGADAGTQAERMIEDKHGNFKLVMPAGWDLETAPPTEPKAVLRLVLARKDANGNNVAIFRVLRLEASSATVFTEWTPGDAIQNFIKVSKGLEFVYGQNSSPHLTANIDESVSLGGADKCGKWTVSSITMEDKAKRLEAETRQRRGEKGVEIPEFKPFVTTGRAAMISPFVYHAYAVVLPSMAADPAINAEITRIFESFEFLKTKELPPGLSIGPIEPGNTVANPEFAKAREKELLHTESGRTVYKLGIEMTLPPGFRLLSKDEYGPVFKDSASISAIVVAQDENHNWAKIIMVHTSSKALGDANKKFADKKQVFEGWKVNWESKARGAKVPSKAGTVNWGKAKGKGYKLLEGEIENWPGTFSGILIDKSGWRTQIEVDTRGPNPLRFEKELDEFFKKLKLDYKVK